MDGPSPFKCVLGHKAKICPTLEVISEAVVTSTFNTYYTKLKEQLTYLRE